MNNNKYPFATKAQIKARLTSDREYALTSLVTLWNLQTSYEQDTKSTQTRNRQGFASSHAVAGSTIAQKIVSPETLTVEEEDRAFRIVSHYSKQLASFERDRAISENPELAKDAACFFTAQ